MRNRIIACLLSLTLVFNSFAPSLAFAVGVGGQDLDEQVESEPVETVEVLEAGEDENTSQPDYLSGSESLLSSGVSGGEELEGLDDGLDTGDSATLDSQLSGLDTGVSGGEESEVDFPGESAVYSTRAVPALVRWLLQTGVSSVVSYGVHDLLFSEDADPLLAVNAGILRALLLDDGYSAIHYIYAYSRDSYSVLTDVYQLLKKIGADVDELEKFLSFTPDDYTFGVAELMYYLMQNTEYVYQGSTLSLAEMLFGITSKATFEGSNGYFYGFAELLYYINQNTEFVDSEGSTLSLAEMLYELVGLSSYESPNGYNYGIAESLFYVMENTDKTVDLLTVISNALSYTDVNGITNTVGRFLYEIYQQGKNIKTIADRLSYTNENGVTNSVGRLVWEIYQQGKNLDTIVSRLTFTNSEGSTYSATSLLYYIHSRLNWNVDGTNYTAGYTLYQIWQRIKNVDSDLDALQTIANRLSYTNENGVTNSVGRLLWELYQQGKNFSSLDQLKDMADSLDILVYQGFRQQLVDRTEVMEEVVGSLDTVALGSQLVELSKLLEKAFPFCLVFGLVAIIELLVAPADAPSFDFPLPDGSGGTFVYTVDLEAFDPAAGVFRGMITIIYIIGLIRITNSFVFKGGADN